MVKNMIIKPATSKTVTPEFESGSDEECEIEPARKVQEPTELEIADTGPDELDCTSSEGLIDIPDESVINTESSDGQGLGFEDMSDGNHENDKDYVMDLDDGDKASDMDSNGEFDLHPVHKTTKMPRNAKSAKVSSLFHPPKVFGYCNAKIH